MSMNARTTAVLIGAFACTSLGGSPIAGTGIWNDTIGDAVVRRTDAGNDAPLPVGFEPIDLVSVDVQGWEPFDPMVDPYSGDVVNADADFVRIVVTLEGLVAPPGPLGIDGSPYDPYRYGARPIFGSIELDIDDQKNSGGEFMPIARNRYLANVGRFGLSPLGSISERIVRSADDIDSNFYTLPEFERTGGEFILTLCGCFTPTIESQNGDMDGTFDEGEDWILSGRFFERFVSFAPESGLFGGSDFGLFDPVVDLRFVHDTQIDRTTIMLVFPITNEGAAMLEGGSVQEIDSSLWNHTSIEEALDDLINGAEFASGALSELCDDWRGRDLDDYRQPREWFVHALIGTAPVTPDPTGLFIWTDTGFNEVFADLNDDDQSDELDETALLDRIALLDGTSEDEDATVNGEVVIPDFGFSFDLADLNGDGIIAPSDFPNDCAADLTGDGALDFFDLSALLQNQVDWNGDTGFDFFDLSSYLMSFSAGCP